MVDIKNGNIAKLCIETTLVVLGTVLLALSIKSLYEYVAIYGAFGFLNVVSSTFAAIVGLVLGSMILMYLGVRIVKGNRSR